MNIYIQYICIVVILVFAVWYIINLAKDTFTSKKDDKNCGSNCGCK